MQTFVPYTNDYDSAHCLDNRRLLKQIVECSQILKALRDSTYGWQNHPAVRMWRGSEQRLINYTWAMQRTYYLRHGKFVNVNMEPELRTNDPAWWGGPIHASHRANLLRKLPTHYAQFGWSESPDMQYVWPM